MRPQLLPRLAVLALVLSLVPGTLAAQGDSSRLVPGARALLIVSEGRREERRIGRVLAADSGIVALVGERGDTLAVATSRVRQAWVSAGRTSRARSSGRGALFGALVGGVVGFAAGSDCPNGDFICFDRTVTTPAGLLAGAGLGALIGVAAGGGERWIPASTAARVAVAPTRGGATAALSLRF